MSQSAIIQEAHVTYEELDVLLTKIEEALVGEKRGHAITALISEAFIIMNPMISPDDLKRVVLEASRNMCLLIDGVVVDDDPNGEPCPSQPLVLN